jgi:CRISPR-associated protein Csx3
MGALNMVNLEIAKYLLYNMSNLAVAGGLRLMPLHVIYRIAVPSPITPVEPLPPLPDIPRGSLVIVEGRAPIWRYGMALHKLHSSPAAAIAFYDPRLGAVIVASHNPSFTLGQVIDVTIPEVE